MPPHFLHSLQPTHSFVVPSAYPCVAADTKPHQRCFQYPTNILYITNSVMAEVLSTIAFRDKEQQYTWLRPKPARLSRECPLLLGLS